MPVLYRQGRSGPKSVESMEVGGRRSGLVTTERGHSWVAGQRAYRGEVTGPVPDDADSWSDEEWLAWLAEVDAEAPPLPEGHPLRHGRSLPSAMLGAAMLGLHRVIYGEGEVEVQMVVEADGETEPERLEVHLDPEDPEASQVTVRPWLDGEA